MFTFGSGFFIRDSFYKSHFFWALDRSRVCKGSSINLARAGHLMAVVALLWKGANLTNNATAARCSVGQYGGFLTHSVAKNIFQIHKKRLFIRAWCVGVEKVWQIRYTCTPFWGGLIWVIFEISPLTKLHPVNTDAKLTIFNRSPITTMGFPDMARFIKGSFTNSTSG